MIQVKKQYFYAAIYLRLSRDDQDKGGKIKSESDSIGNQRELLKAFVKRQPNMELYDIYVDDGFSGGDFNRPGFQRMLADVEAGRANCIIVKDLSRFGRDYIESGRYIQKVFPSLGVRFIALTDGYDSFFADSGESAIILPIKNFINDAYCRDISTKVKSGLEVKRQYGKCIAPFAVYGYLKDEKDKNHLVVDRYAAENVRAIFKWKIEGLAVSAIADKLNGLGILSPKEYKKSIGIQFNGGFCGTGTALWSSAAVKRILTNEVYLGHLIQGKMQRVNYKVKKNVAKPKEEWVRVENTHEAIISEDDFEIVQDLLQSDVRVSPKMQGTEWFSGMLFCGDCGEQMVRRVNRYKDSEKIYYICSTKNRREGCSRHSVEATTLRALVNSAVPQYVNASMDWQGIFTMAKSRKMHLGSMARYGKEIERLRKEQDKYSRLCCSLYKDFSDGIITKEEFKRLHEHFSQQKVKLGNSQRKQKALVQELQERGILSAVRLKEFLNLAKLKDLDRHTLSSLVKRIYIYEDKRIELEFSFTDVYQMMLNVHRTMEEADRGT